MKPVLHHNNTISLHFVESSIETPAEIQRTVRLQYLCLWNIYSSIASVVNSHELLFAKVQSFLHPAK